MKKLKHPKVKTKEIRFLTVAEINSLIEVISSDNDRDLILMYIHTGARAVEILKNHFTWDNVDFESKSISLLGKGNKYRSVPMNRITYEILYRRKNIELHKIPFNYTYDMVYKRVVKYYSSANIHNACIHTLRKTFGSLMVQNDVSIYTVSKLMGHSNVLVTERHYAKLNDKSLRDGVKELSKLGIR